MATLTQEQVRKFHRDGYLRFGRVLSADQVEQLRAELDRIIREEEELADAIARPPEFRWGHRRGGATGDGGYGGRAIHQFVNMWKVSPTYREVIHHPIITGAIRDLMHVDRIRLWHDQVISKPPHENDHFACHHDFYFWPLDRPTMITCWLALDDAFPENGCMHVVPGSHRDPRYQPADCDLSEDIYLSPVPGGPGEPGSLYHDIKTWMPHQAVAVPLKAGECMFHHCLNWHMTPKNVTERQRRAFVIIYMPDGTRYKHAQSPNHVCTNYLGLADGVLMAGENFPVVGEASEGSAI